jgi:hypothetical protein
MKYTKFKKKDSKSIYSFFNKQTNKTYLEKLHSIFLNKISMNKFNKNLIHLRKSNQKIKKKVECFFLKFKKRAVLVRRTWTCCPCLDHAQRVRACSQPMSMSRSSGQLGSAHQGQGHASSLGMGEDMDKRPPKKGNLLKTNCYKSLNKKHNIQLKIRNKSNFFLFFKKNFRRFLFELTNLSRASFNFTSLHTHSRWIEHTPRRKENLICFNYSPLYKRRLHNLDKNFWFQYYNFQNLFFKTYKSLNNKQYLSQINELLKSKLINFFIFNDFFWKITDTVAFILEFSNELKDYDKNIKQPNFLRLKHLNTNYLVNNNLIHNYLNLKKTYRDSKISDNKQRFLKTRIYLKIKKNRNLWFFQLLFFLVGSHLLTIVKKFDFKQYIKKQIFNYHLTLKNSIDQISSYLENKMTAEDFLFRGLSKQEKNSNSSKFIFFMFCTEFINKNCALYNQIDFNFVFESKSNFKY